VHSPFLSMGLFLLTVPPWPMLVSVPFKSLNQCNAALSLLLAKIKCLSKRYRTFESQEKIHQVLEYKRAGLDMINKN